MANEHLESGRKPLIIAELDLDFCSNTYGNSLTSPKTGTCTASGASGTECYNTRVTCQDPANYIRGTKTYRFCEQNSDVISGEAGIPAIVQIPDCAPAKITSGKGLGDRASISIKLQDFPHHDRGIDPYVSTRSYTPEEQGTFFGKLLVRNPYFIGRTLRMRIGYITDPFDLASFRDCEYILDSINGPDKNYRYTIVAKDILKLADDKKAQCPKSTTGKLTSDLSGTSSPLPFSFTVSDTGINAYNITRSTILKFLDISEQDILPSDISFKSDGTSMYMIGEVNQKIFQYELSTPWDISTASYDANSPLKNLDISAQDSSPKDIAFKTDGTTMYMLGNFNDTIFQYELSIAWDISTASYDANSPQKSFSVASEDLLPTGLAFKPDGTKMYVIGGQNDNVYQYELSVAWDITTADYTANSPQKSFSVSSEDLLPQGIFFNPDGTIMHMIGVTNKSVYQYVLSTAWDITTSSYTSKSYNVSSQDTNPQGIFFNNDGELMYVIGEQNDKVYQYSAGENQYERNGGRVRINDELIDYSTGTIIDNDTFIFNTLTRGIGNTEIASHSTDDTVQLCKVYTDENITDILYDLLVNCANIPSRYIPTTEWNAEKDLWLIDHNLSVTLSEPEGVNSLISEITEQNLVDIWWDIIQQKIRIKSISPEHLNAILPIYDESKHLIEDSIIAKKDDKDRLTQVWVYYGKRILTEDDKPEFYRYLYVASDSDAEGENKYDSKQVKKFISRWIQSGALAGTLANRLLNRYRDGAQRIEFQIDQKDEDIVLGESIQINTRAIQDVDGSNDIKTYQVTFSDFFRPGSTIKLQGIELNFYARYAFIVPDTSPVIPDYSLATEEQREKYAFVAPDSGFFDDERPAYKII